jgi:hypothetical protein
MELGLLFTTGLARSSGHGKETLIFVFVFLLYAFAGVERQEGSGVGSKSKSWCYLSGHVIKTYKQMKMRI